MLTSVQLCCIISFVRLRNTAHGGVAQVVERFVRDEEAASSSLVTPTDENTVNLRVCSVFILLFFDSSPKQKVLR